MFKRFLGRKERTPQTETKEERKLRLIVQTAATIDDKIRIAERKVDALEAKREKLMSAAKAAKRANRTLGDTWGNQLSLELKRILQSVALCDKSIKRQSAISLNLSKMKDMCEAYLDQSDFLIAVRDATTLIEEFGLKPEQADELLDKMRDLHDITGEVDTTLIDTAEEGLDNADLDDLMNELDLSLEEDAVAAAADKTSGLPAAPSTTTEAEATAEPKLPEAPIADPVKKQTLVKPSTFSPSTRQAATLDNTDEDLEDMLNNL